MKELREWLEDFIKYTEKKIDVHNDKITHSKLLQLEGEVQMAKKIIDKIDKIKSIKTVKVVLPSIKDSDGWMELAHTLKFEEFKVEHPELDEVELSNRFYTDVIAKTFLYGEFATIEVEIDAGFNIVGGKIIDKL